MGKPEWFEDYHALTMTARHLVTVEGYDAMGVIRFFEKPWNYKREYSAACLAVTKIQTEARGKPASRTSGRPPGAPSDE